MKAFFFGVALWGWMCALVAQDAIRFSENVLHQPQLQRLEACFDTVYRLPIYQPTPQNNVLLLQNGYAQAHIRDTSTWAKYAPTHHITAVSLVFTHYPKALKRWQYAYPKLLADRVRAVLERFPSANRQDVRWSIQLQTACNTAATARKRWHGVEIHYAPNHKPPTTKKYSPPRLTRHHRKRGRFLQQSATLLQKYQGDFDTTSAVQSILEAHPEWTNSTVVIDYTGSMYIHTQQVLAFATEALNEGKITRYVFFNDGNNRPTTQKQIGQTGGFYTVETHQYQEVLRTLRTAYDAGDGGDAPENDVEALRYAMRKFPDSEHFILIADNMACVRDMALLPQLDRPVHVILCAKSPDVNLNRQYLEIAAQTQGSLNWQDETWTDFSAPTLLIDGHKYIRQPNGQYKVKKGHKKGAFYDCN